MDSITIKQTEGTLFGHPKGLFILFMVEMWERFSYYGMRALLVFYMTKQLLFGQEHASHVYGIYTGLVYLTPLFGGILADRFLGQRKSVYIGGILMAIGHFLMAFENLFYMALGFLIIGNGAFKPNISTQVGNLYPVGDSRRDSAFSIFYVGVNIGSFFAPLVCGTLGELWGWHYGFGVAGVGMLVGLVIYMWGEKYLAPDNLTASKNISNNKGSEPLNRKEKLKIGVLIVLCILTIPFWIAFEQQGNTLALWADADTERHVFGWEVPATWFLSLNPLFVFTVTPLLTAFWAWQSRHGKTMSSIAKMVMGCMLLGGSFIIMIPAGMYYETDGIPVSMWWLIMSTLVMTLGELYLSPIGMSMVTKLAPVRLVSMCMGIWYLSSFAGNLLAGYIGGYWEMLSKAQFFSLLAVVVSAAGSATWLYLYFLNRSSIKDEIAKV